jgi:hypothetical protein
MAQRDTGIVVADVLCTSSDETLYVLDRYDHQPIYEGGWLEDVTDRLRTDGWSRCGYVTRGDGVSVALWGRGSEYLAVWDRVIQPYRMSQ